MNTAETIKTGFAGFVAWELIDGSVMCGEPTERWLPNGFMTYSVRRVDGTVCYVDASKLRPATYDDISEALAFYGIRHHR